MNPNAIMKSFLFICLAVISIFLLQSYYEIITSYSSKKQFTEIRNKFNCKGQLLSSLNDNENPKNIYTSSIFKFKPVARLDDEGKTEVMYDYNQQALLQRKIYKQDNQIYYYEYNAQNQIIKKIKTKNEFFLSEVNRQNFYLYEYNDKDQLITIKNNQNQIQFEYQYDRKGQLIRKIKHNLHGKPDFYKSVYIYKYNDKGQRIEKLYDSIIRFKKKLFFKYSTYKKINQLIYTYKYNNENQRIKKITKNGNEYTYKYYEFES
ncbi:MAG: hypothetical protein Q8899_01795 [Weeping tea tree witches'-broom phytoplasma]|uniref:RHS repeat domain-containing protein n=1 Tax=Candidatus Phytoplasma melaleucae TaxID=2982630 RepID=UPI00293A638F|nr:hypothetical protein [Weeping tea tree witches'-broom phytoplasma]